MSRFIENIRTQFLGMNNATIPSFFGQYYTIYFDKKEVHATAAISTYFTGKLMAGITQNITARFIEYDFFDDSDNKRSVSVLNKFQNQLYIEKCNSITAFFEYNNCLAHGQLTFFEYSSLPTTKMDKNAKQFMTFLVYIKKTGEIMTMHEYDFTEYTNFKIEKEKFIASETLKLNKTLSKDNKLFLYEGERLDIQKEMKIDIKSLKLITY